MKRIIKDSLLVFCLAAANPALAGSQEGATTTAGTRWGADYFPNVPLTTHEGEQVRFFDDLIEGKVVVINFIYTSCPDSCPLETARLKEVYDILGGRVGEDVFFYSITIDPDRDTPEVLAEYAERYQAGEGWWFLTGDEEDIIQLRKKLGLYIDEIQAEDSNDHNLSMILGNQATGRWKKSSPFENPYVLAGQIGDWLHNYKLPPRSRDGSGGGYEHAPELRSITKGESLFRTRCAVCHAIGDRDRLPRVGPNLLGVVERREREWLERWIAEPDRMLAEKDPIAHGLYLAYNKVPMPNFRLGEYEVDSLLDYLETESRRVEGIQGREAAEKKGDADEPASCCLKKDNLTLGPEDVAVDESPGVRPGTGFLRVSMLLSGGLGWGLVLLTVILRRRLG